MKSQLQLLLLLIFGILSAASCKKENTLKAEVKYSDDQYNFTTHYSPEKTKEVQATISQHISSAQSKADGDWNQLDVSGDKTTFNVISTPGDLKFEFNKNENSRSSYHRI